MSYPDSYPSAFPTILIRVMACTLEAPRWYAHRAATPHGSERPPPRQLAPSCASPCATRPQQYFYSSGSAVANIGDNMTILALSLNNVSHGNSVTHESVL